MHMGLRARSVSPKTLRRLIVAGVAALLIAVGLYVFDRWAYHGPLNFDGREIPPWGLVDNPRAIGHPGHPEEVEAAFRRIYPAMIAFRRIHGRLPTPQELEDWSKPLAPGHQLTQADFKFKDDYLNDGYSPLDRHASELMLSYEAPRPDGSPKPADPPQGEKDVWLVCMDYAHANIVYTRAGPSLTTPTGFFIVLYSDGSIVRVPYGDVMLSQDADGSLDHVMPGQTGIRKGTKTVKGFDKAAMGSKADYSHENQAVLP